jgi:hypothetical protein
LESRRPAKNHSFLVVFAGFAGKYHEKMEILGRLRRPKPHHRVSRVKKKSTMLPQATTTIEFAKAAAYHQK